MSWSIWSRLKELFRQPAPEHIGQGTAASAADAMAAPQEVPMNEPPAVTLELVSSAGGGKTSVVWSLLYMLRQLSWVWPQYLCWSQDESTEAEIRRLHGSMLDRRLPERDADGGRHLYRLHLRQMERWGDVPLILADERDSLFGGGADVAAGGRPINWGVPICWLLNLPDLDTIDAQLIDVQLNDLVRARLRSAHSLEAEPLRLVIAIAKADRLARLPDALRRYLKADPLAAVVEAESDLEADGVQGGDPALHFDGPAIEGYLRTLSEVQEEIVEWLAWSLGGRLLARRAQEHHLDVRYCVLSATGSDLASGGRLEIPWSPRRVLDPLLWALELGKSRPGWS